MDNSLFKHGEVRGGWVSKKGRRPIDSKTKDGKTLVEITQNSEFRTTDSPQVLGLWVMYHI